MPRNGRKRPITHDWMPIETIKGVPNVVTSFVTIYKYRKMLRDKGIPIPKKRHCIYCGRPYRNHRALQAHLQFCDKKRQYLDAMKNGFRFHIADKSFVIRSDCWGYIREAASLEESLNRDITAGNLDEETAIKMFYLHARGHVVSWHNERTEIVSIPGPDAAPTAPIASAAE